MMTAALGKPLSAQESRIVRLLTHFDMEAGSVARQIGISEETVKSYIKRAHRKIGCNSRSQLTKWALANGLASIEGFVVMSEDKFLEPTDAE